MLAIGVYVFVGVPNIDFSKLSLGETLGGGLTLTELLSATVGLLTSTLSGAGSVSQIADDTKNPSRDIPLTLILAPTFVCIIYMLMAIVTIGCMDGDTVANLADVGGALPGRRPADLLHRGRPHLRHHDQHRPRQSCSPAPSSRSPRTTTSSPPSSRGATSTASPR